MKLTIIKFDTSENSLKMKQQIKSYLFLFLAVAVNAVAQDIGQMKKDVSFLASDALEGREIGFKGEVEAATYLAKRFEAIGLIPKGTNGYIQDFSVKPSNNPHDEAKVGENGDSTIIGHNVVGYIDNGSDNIVIIGAHFDHLGFGGIGSLHKGEKAVHNGADDNASGTASIIQIADLLKNKNTNNNYLIIAFSGEEQGLWGSNYFSKNATIDMERVNYMLNLDMVGRLNEEKSLAINGVGTSPQWNKALEEIGDRGFKLIKKESGVGPSDHTSFYLKDIPVLHFFTGQHVDYHKPSDDAEKLNYEGMAGIVQFIDALISSLDLKDKIAFTKTKDESTSAPRFTVTLGVVPDYLYGDEGMRIDGISEGKPAQKAGLQVGDIVIKMGDTEVKDMMSYMKALSGFKKGDTTTVILLRKKEKIKVGIEF